VIRTELDIQGARVQRLALEQRDPQGRHRLWPQQLRVTVGCGAQPRRIVAELVEREIDLTRALDGCVPDYVLAGGEGWGYGEFELDARSQDHLLTRLPAIADPLARGVAWSGLWEAMLGGRLAPTAWFEMATLNLRTEHDAQLFGEWMDDLVTVWWRFLTPTQRAERAPGLEALVRGRLDAAAEPGAKSTWFAGLRKIAITPPTVAWLRALWQREATLPGLPLVEADETALAYALALRGVEGLEALLDAQRDRITNPDRKARFEFVRAAVSADAGERERWFRALADPANRRREQWVVQGLGLLNHPLRGELSARWVPASLDLLLEVSRTGALFFDAFWLEATLGWHSSPEVMTAVTRFVDTLPADYPPKLRAKVLQSSDLLMRAARLGGR
jgi:aminopeptidase N